MKVKAELILHARMNRHEMGIVIMALDAYASDHANGAAAQTARDMHTTLYRQVNGIDQDGNFVGPNYLD